MKKVITIAIIMVQLLVVVLSVNAADVQLSDYEKYYPQFVDTKEPLSELLDKDMQDWVDADISHPVLSEVPDPNRTDYFDIAYGTDPMQKLDIHHLNGKQIRPVIVYIHGGGWVSGDKSETRYAGPTWISLGYTVVSINYRLAPQYSHPAQIEDCAMALKWILDNVDKYGGDPSNLAIVGHSAGSHLAALLVTGEKWQKMYGIDMRKVKCWIPISGIHDFNLPENYYHPNVNYFCNALVGSPDNKDDSSPVMNVTGNEPPSLIIHGGDDELAARSNSIELYNKLKQKGAKTQLEIVKHYWHCNMIVNFGERGHKPTQIINKYLSKYLPVDKKCSGK